MEDLPHRFRFQASSCPGECNDLQAATAMALHHAELSDVSESATDYARFCLQSCSPPTAKQSLCLGSGETGRTIWKKQMQRLKKRCKQRLSHSELFDKYAVELIPWAKLGERLVNGPCLSHGSKICLVSNVVGFHSYAGNHQPVQPILVENLNWACRGIPLTRGM